MQSGLETAFVVEALARVGSHFRAFRYTGVAQKMAMNSNLLGYPSIWERSPTFVGTPVFGNALQCARVPQYMGMH
jgi:hypothetical protein